MPVSWTGCQATPDLMGWYGNEDGEEVLRRGVQGQGGAGSDLRRRDAGDAAKVVGESELEKLHAKIGQLVVERDF